MVSQQRYLDHEEAQHRRVLGEYKDLLENHVKLRADTTKVCVGVVIFGGLTRGLLVSSQKLLN